MFSHTPTHWGFNCHGDIHPSHPTQPRRCASRIPGNTFKTPHICLMCARKPHCACPQCELQPATHSRLGNPMANHFASRDIGHRLIFAPHLLVTPQTPLATNTTCLTFAWVALAHLSRHPRRTTNEPEATRIAPCNCATGVCANSCGGRLREQHSTFCAASAL